MVTEDEHFKFSYIMTVNGTTKNSGTIVCDNFIPTTSSSTRLPKEEDIDEDSGRVVGTITKIQGYLLLHSILNSHIDPKVLDDKCMLIGFNTRFHQDKLLLWSISPQIDNYNLYNYVYYDIIDIKQVFLFVTQYRSINNEYLTVNSACKELGIPIDKKRESELFYSVELIKTIHDKLSHYITGGIV
jgi:hypothetical protein